MARLDPTITTASIAALEAMVNTALKYDPGSRLALEKLGGQVLAVESTVPEFELFIASGPEGLRVMGACGETVTTRLRGPLPALLQLAVADTTTLADSGVEVLGSTGLLTNLQRIAANLDIDWEEALSQLLGDVAGHQLAEHLRVRFRWLGGRLSSGQRLLSEYLTEELRSLPSKPDLEGFFSQVDELRLGADRLAARVAQLQQSLDQRALDKNAPNQSALNKSSDDNA